LRKKVIVGIDPGTTTGIAILSLRGKPLTVMSERSLGKDGIIKYISSFGFPTIVSTDKAKVPSMIEEVATNFRSMIASPDEDLTKSEKLSLTRKFDTRNSHERDALASAIHAYLRYKELFKRTESVIEKLNLWRYEDDIKDLVVRKKVKNISDAIDIVLSRKKDVKREIKKLERNINIEQMGKVLDKLRESIKEKEKTIMVLENYSHGLEESLRSSEETISKLNKKIDNLKKKKNFEKKNFEVDNLKEELRKKSNEIKKLKNDIKVLREIENVRKSGMIPVKIIDNTSYEALMNAEKSFGIRSDILYFKKYTKITRQFIRKLNENNVEILIGNFPEKIMEDLSKSGISVLKRNEIDIKIKNFVGRISKDDLKNIEKKSFLKWLKDYKERFG